MDFKALISNWQQRLRRRKGQSDVVDGSAAAMALPSDDTVSGAMPFDGAHAEGSNSSVLDAAPADGVGPAQVCMIERRPYAFGLDWRFYGDGKELRQTLWAAHRSGLSHYILGDTQDLIGLMRGLSGTFKGKPQAAALQLAQSVSRGGMELFVFKIGPDLYSITGLQDSRPVLPFDRVGSRSEILTLAGQFQLQCVGQELRQAGNTGELEDEENLKLADAFGQPVEKVGLKAVPNFRLILIGAGALLVLGLIGGTTSWWLGKERAQAEQTRKQRESDPNVMYEKVVEAGVKAMGLPAQLQLSSWRETVKDIPESHAGWDLNKVNCSADRCEALWERKFGNYQDFYLTPLPGLIAAADSQTADNPAQAGIKTVHKVNLPANPTEALARADLPPLRESMQLLASQLQDLALLPNGDVKVGQPALYPAVQGVNAQQVHKPVVQGKWSLSHELWTLGDLDFKGKGLSFQTLTIVRDEKTQEWMYLLTGSYHAKAKDF